MAPFNTVPARNQQLLERSSVPHKFRFSSACLPFQPCDNITLQWLRTLLTLAIALLGVVIAERPSRIRSSVLLLFIAAAALGAQGRHLEAGAAASPSRSSGSRAGVQGCRRRSRASCRTRWKAKRGLWKR